MIETERLLMNRARTLFHAAMGEPDRELRAVLLEQHRRLAMKAAAIQFWRKRFEWEVISHGYHPAVV